jgi:hypothetical protein
MTRALGRVTAHASRVGATTQDLATARQIACLAVYGRWHDDCWT